MRSIISELATSRKSSAPETARKWISAQQTPCAPELPASLLPGWPGSAGQGDVLTAGLTARAPKCHLPSPAALRSCSLNICFSSRGQEEHERAPKAPSDLSHLSGAAAPALSQGHLLS